MNFLTDPNVGYVLAVGGLILAILALFTPGTGLLEIGALFALVLAGFSISNFAINSWALVLLVVGIVPFILAMRRSGKIYYFLIALAALVVGSVFLIATPEGGIAVNPYLAIVISALASGFLWLMGRSSLSAMALPTKNLTQLIGKTGEAHTDIFAEGSAYVDGEEWSARSLVFIPLGSQVRVVGREGLVLLVEPVQALS
jgi:membrane-bound serine protease (ClpP class)